MKQNSILQNNLQKQTHTQTVKHTVDRYDIIKVREEKVDKISLHIVVHRNKEGVVNDFQKSHVGLLGRYQFWSVFERE